MIASVYIKDGNIHFYNEKSSSSNIGGLALELGKPLLNFVCYEDIDFDEGFNMMAEVLDNEYAYVGIKEPEFIKQFEQMASEMQKQEIYVYFYFQMFVDFIYNFIESPEMAIEKLSEKLPAAKEKLDWAKDFKWTVVKTLSQTPDDKVFTETSLPLDKEKRLYRAAKDVIALMFEDLKHAKSSTISEIELLLLMRKKSNPSVSGMSYLYMMEESRKEHTGQYYFVENPFRVFYGMTKPQEVVLLYEIDSIKDLIRFEFVKMVEHNIFIKKCKNCNRFFIPRRRADAEYCDRIFGEGNRKCSEVGAMLRYEKKVAENPILDAHKKAYRRFNSRTRTGKMSQAEFLAWSEESAQKRDACLAGELSFDEFVAWLEQGRMRKSRGK